MATQRIHKLTYRSTTTHADDKATQHDSSLVFYPHVFSVTVIGDGEKNIEH